MPGGLPVRRAPRLTPEAPLLMQVLLKTLEDETTGDHMGDCWAEGPAGLHSVSGAFSGATHYPTSSLADHLRGAEVPAGWTSASICVLALREVPVGSCVSPLFHTMSVHPPVTEASPSTEAPSGWPCPPQGSWDSGGGEGN